MNKKLLEEIGLTKGEITVYLTLLKIGETTTGKIIEEAQISSGKIYEILDKLMKKGLVSFITKEKTKYFSAASPKRILDYMHQKEKDLKSKEQELIEDLPNLLELEKFTKKKIDIKLFQGYEGIRTAIWEVLSELTLKDEVIAMGVHSKKQEKFNLLWPPWHKERIKKKITCRIILTEKGTEYYNMFKKMKYTEVKTIEGITPSAIDVIGDLGMIFSHGENPSVLSIKHPDIVQSFKTFFESVLGQAKS